VTATPFIPSWELRDSDRELFARELQSFVPDRIFDAHAHLYEKWYFPEGTVHRRNLTHAPDTVGLAEFRSLSEWITPGRHVDALFLPFPVHGDLAAITRFTAAEALRDPGCRAEMLVSPDMDPEYVREEVRRSRLAGLKCYHIYSARDPTFDSLVEEFLPEPLVKVADDEALCITLHMVRARALADPANQATILAYCRKYPRMQMVLAHAGRGFNPHHTIEGIHAIRGVPNLWFDSAAVTDCGAFEAIIRTIGHDRLLYGSDFFISHLRGRAVAIGDGFAWLYEDSLDWSAFKYADVRPTLAGLESLRCLKVAAFSLGLTDSQVEDIFYHNARRMLGLE
jgi:glutamate-1-semialdehyde 2,1-aminomutase